MHESEKTHQQMLPQSAALESASADNREGKDETGRGGWGDPATGVQHGRAETVRDHLPTQRHSVERTCPTKQKIGALRPHLALPRHGCSWLTATDILSCLATQPGRASFFLSTATLNEHGETFNVSTAGTNAMATLCVVSRSCQGLKSSM